MNTHSRRAVVALAGGAALSISRLAAQGDHGHHHGDDEDDQMPCGTPMSTPHIVPYDSDIPFDLAYIDTMIPHHESVVMLSEVALDELSDERLVEIAQAVIDTQPGEIDQLMQFRDEWYPDEPLEVSDDRLMEMMMVTMAGQGGCGDDDHHNGIHNNHMDLMDGEKLVQAFQDADDTDLGFIDLVIPHHQMAVYQSQAGLELAEHEELRELCEEVIRVQSEEIEALKAIRKDLESDT